MISNTILDLLKKYKLVEESAELPDVWDEKEFREYPNILIGELLCTLVENEAVHYGDPSGMWESGNLVGEFSSIISDYVDASNGQIEIENLNTINPTDEDGEDDPDEEMTIEFDHKNKHYKWEFIMDEPDDYYKAITNLANNALNGNVFFYGEESFVAFCIPKELVKELVDLGATSKSDYFG